MTPKEKEFFTWTNEKQQRANAEFARVALAQKMRCVDWDKLDTARLEDVALILEGN